MDCAVKSPLNLRQVRLVGVATLILWLCACRGGPKGVGGPAGAGKAYFSSIAVTDARMMAAENFLNQRVVTMTARLTNRGGKTVSQVELRLDFKDLNGKLVQQEIIHPITEKTPPLKPGESRPFSVSFEQMADAWNQAPPEVEVTKVKLQ